MDTGTTKPKTKKSSRNGRPSRRTKKLDQRFSDYIWFGFQTTFCLGIFVGCYAMVLLIMWPLLTAHSPPPPSTITTTTITTTTIPDDPSQTKQSASHRLRLPPVLKEVVQHDKEVMSEMAGVVRERLNKLRQGRGVTDAALLDQARAEFEELHAKKLQEDKDAAAAVAVQRVNPKGVSTGKDSRRGFIVLGMHRSGTSMLSGLLVTSCGYNVGDHLIESAADNEKGFFERVDIVLQNDEFLRRQNAYWAANVINYDWEQALRDKEDGVAEFEENGRPGLEFLNNPANIPWLQKDPRMCITLKTWLQLMNSEPAIVFTYRHPMEVAMSLKKREQSFTLEHGLRLWIIYNMRAIQNSNGLCIVYSSNDKILADPMIEVQRISDELTTRCHVPPPPYKLQKEDVDKFIDPNLQHNKNRRAQEEKEENREVIATYNDGKCIVHSYKTETEEGSDERKRETELYGWAMKIFCDLESGKAYEDNYKWPDLPK